MEQKFRIYTIKNRKIMETKQINELVQDIRFLNKMYRAGTPITTDSEYDKKIELLKSVDPDNEIFSKGIIEKEDSSIKRKLPYPMYSLNKEKSIEGIKDWVKKKGLKDDDFLIITPKLDGISILENKVSYSTRGDGETGQACDEHMKKVLNHSHRNLTSAGEVIILKDMWRVGFQGKVSPKGLPYKNSRNTVAGLFNNEQTGNELYSCTYIRYNLPNSIEDKITQISECNKFNKNKLPFYITDCKNINYDLLEELYREWSVNLPIDGLVIDVNSYEIREKLGRELNNNPSYSIAYKNPKWSEEVESVVTGYKFQTSKQGKLKGTIQIEPVIIDGVEVSQATFYNAKYLLDIFPIIGSQIKVKRSGDVIPKITEIHGIHVPAKDEYKSDREFKAAYSEFLKKIDFFLSESKYSLNKQDDLFDIIYTCQSCGETLNWDENHVELLCSNPDCKDIKLGKLEHFFQTCGIEEFGRPSIEILYNNGFDTIKKIVEITKEQISNIENFGEASADIILKQFEVFNTGLPFARILAALDLFEGKIGEKTIQLIIDNSSEDILFSELRVADLINIKGVSEITANLFIKGLKEFLLIPFSFRSFFALSYIQTPQKEVVGDKYKAFKVCFTGVRDASLEDQIKFEGGEIVSGVSKNCTHLIVADLSSTSSKMTKAKELGISILTINQFKQL